MLTTWRVCPLLADGSIDDLAMKHLGEVILSLLVLLAIG
jgi:hypothetical protein